MPPAVVTTTSTCSKSSDNNTGIRGCPHCAHCHPHPHSPTPTFTHTRTHAHTFTHTCTHAPIRTHIYTHARTHHFVLNEEADGVPNTSRDHVGGVSQEDLGAHLLALLHVTWFVGIRLINGLVRERPRHLVGDATRAGARMGVCVKCARECLRECVWEMIRKTHTHQASSLTMRRTSSTALPKFVA